MKIAFLTQSYGPTGGVATYVRELRLAFERMGNAVCVIHSDTVFEKKPDPALHYVAGCDQYETSLAVEAVKSVMAILRHEKPEIVHIQSSMNYPLEAAIRKEFPLVKSLHVHDFCPSGTKFHFALDKVCSHETGAMCLPRMAYKRCCLDKNPATLWMFYDRARKSIQNDKANARIIVASEFVKKEALKSGYREEQVQVIPYFVESKQGSDEVKNDGPKIILATGRVVAEKGLDRLLLAVTHMRTKNDWRLYIDGDGPGLKDLKNKASHLKISHRIEFAGWLPPSDHWKLFRRSNVVVVPSIWPEPFGLVGLEAMSFGKPVVAFNVGGIPDWLSNNETGFLIEPYDVLAMAQKIDELIDRPELALKMGRAGRIKAEEKYQPETHTGKLLKVYNEVIEIKHSLNR